MKGLSDEERRLLTRWSAGQHEGPIDQLPSSSVVAALALYERGCGADVAALGPLGFGFYATVTPVGELALRCDSAARAAGVWP